MHGSNLPVRKWYLAMAFMTITKKGISAKELQRQLDHKRYDTIWSLMHRIRNAMGNKEDTMTINGIISFNDSYFLSATPDGRKLKRGKVNQFIIKKDLPTEKTKNAELEEHFHSMRNYWKLKVIHQNKMLTQSFAESSFTMSSSKKKNIKSLSKFICAFRITNQGFKSSKNEEQRNQIIIDNAKKAILGVYHKIKGKYLQLYLDEFCFKLNRTSLFQSLFQNLTGAIAHPF